MKYGKRQHGGAAEKEEQAAAAAGGERSKKRRRRASKLADDQNLPQDELARRQRQRKLRDLALRLRAEGKVYKKGKHKKHKPRRRVQLIIVPIFWQKKAGEKAVVLEAAEKVQELLRGFGVKCDTDTTTELTPGQKFRHWEEKGVMLRVELGPKEATEGTCILARCRKAGEVAEKQTVVVGPQLCERVKQQLEDMGQTLAPPEAGTAAAAAGEEAQQQADEEQRQEGAPAPAMKRAKKGSGADEQVGQREQQAGADAAAAAAPAALAQQQQWLKAKQLGSAEELEGDFAGVALLPEPGTGKKGKKKAAAAAVVAAEVVAFEQLLPAADQGSGGKKKGKAKHKLVTF